ncbi:hypothetical protein LPTSP4_27430 [Leptospira ryugenii]|uniref:Uncharacterized protein n=1 Tax=Leptospira ryugenii TaxID=1917863 RepID=A0A2P2E2X6_9LEPT|nr:hypothetical protein [Leptospira ryugenii]GBF51211.1 hypothetical protein LPTSP4_27430 [Leptospira ryugenii]
MRESNRLKGDYNFYQNDILKVFSNGSIYKAHPEQLSEERQIKDYILNIPLTLKVKYLVQMNGERKLDTLCILPSLNYKGKGFLNIFQKELSKIFNFELIG